MIRDRREEERPGKAGSRDWGDVSTRIAGCTRSQEKGEEILSVGATRRPILPTLWLQTAHLQNHGRGNLQGWKPPRLHGLLWQSWAPSKALHVTQDFLLSCIFFFFLNFFGIFQQGSRTIISELPLFKISVTSLHKTSFRFRRKASVVTPHTPGVNHRCEHASCALHGNIFALFAHTEQMVQSWNKNEPSFGPSPDSRLYEHMGYKPPYIFYTNSHLFCFYFNSPGLKVPFKRCHGLSSVNFLLSIKMQIHTSAQRAIDLGKL